MQTDVQFQTQEVPMPGVFGVKGHRVEIKIDYGGGRDILFVSNKVFDTEDKAARVLAQIHNTLISMSTDVSEMTVTESIADKVNTPVGITPHIHDKIVNDDD